MTSGGRVKVIVASRMVPARTIDLYRPVYSQSGLLLGSERFQSTVYEKSYAPEHVEAINAARNLSCNLGLDFEVVDRSSVNPLRRLVSAFMGGRSLEQVIQTT